MTLAHEDRRRFVRRHVILCFLWQEEPWRMAELWEKSARRRYWAVPEDAVFDDDPQWKE